MKIAMMTDLLFVLTDLKLFFC